MRGWWAVCFPFLILFSLTATAEQTLFDPSAGFWSNKPELHTRCSELISYRKRTLRPPIQHFVMGPLERVTDWDAFSKRLAVLKSLGAHAITTDVYWAWVEKEEGKFDWFYYREYFRRVRLAGLRWVPIFSFHKIGGNVGDNVDIGLPDWVWKKNSDMRFRNLRGMQSDEYVHFLVPEAYDWYERVMESFRNEFWEDRKGIAKIYLGLGPAGELRFPSYVPAFGWRYPETGELQAFTERDLNSFRLFLKARYQTVENLNRAWGLQFSSFDDGLIRPPTDGEQFFKTGRQTQYGADFLDWYQFVLENHLFELMHRARRVFLPFDEFTDQEKHLLAHPENALTVFYGPGALDAYQRPHFRPAQEWVDARIYWKYRSLAWRQQDSVPIRPDFFDSTGSIGVKLAGIHWQHSNSEQPRSAAQAAGYTTYDSLLALIRIMGGTATFTCMEMQDGGDSTPGSFSNPRSLVEEIAEKARFMDLPLYGENALSMYDSSGFKNIASVFANLEVHGFTLLRMGDLVDGNGNPTPLAQLYKIYITSRSVMRFLYESNFHGSAVEGRGLELRLVGNDPEMQQDLYANSVKMDHYGMGIWSADLDANYPARISWQVWLVDPVSREPVAKSEWIPPEHLSIYGLREGGFDGIVVKMPSVPLFLLEPAIQVRE